MYCEHCGKSLGPDARFCSACGKTVNAEAPGSEVANYATTQADIIPNDEPLIVVRSVFIGWPILIAVVPIQLFFTIWAGGFCGGFGMLAVQFLSKIFGLHVPAAVTFVFFACAAFFGIPIVAYFGKRNGYAKTEYRFCVDRLEYYTGFLAVNQKVVLYRDVLEVELRKGMIQRRYGLGTVKLVTASGWAGYNRGNNIYRPAGVQVQDIPNSDEVYESVKQLVREAKEASAASRVDLAHGRAQWREDFDGLIITV